MHSNTSRTKNQAKLLTSRLAEMNIVLSHGHALEGLAAIAGYRNWHAYADAMKKEAVIEPISPPALTDSESMVLNAFLAALPGLQFQSGVAVGARKQVTVGFHLGNGLIIFFENQLREKCMEQLPLEARASFGGEYRDHGKLSDYSTILTQALHKKEWLITEWAKWEYINPINPVLRREDARLWQPSYTDRWVLPAAEAVWNIISNGYTYNCMLIVQLPEDLRGALPPKTKYRIVVKEPHFEHLRAIAGDLSELSV